MKVAGTTEKKPTTQAVFLCRDWHNGIVKVLVVNGKRNANKASNVLSAIHNTFHYNYHYKNEQYAEFMRDVKLSKLFDSLNRIPHDFSDGEFIDVWNTNGLKYHDAYWGF
jgi:hypothetical protein